MQKFIATGRITRDLELKYSKNNEPFVILPIAILDAKKDAQPVYINFIVYGKMAPIHCEHLGKGSLVYIEAYIYQKATIIEGKKKIENNFYATYVEYQSSSKRYKTEGEQVLDEIQKNITQINEQQNIQQDSFEDLELPFD